VNEASRAAQPILRVENLGFTQWGRRDPTLSGISLALYAGEIVAVLGRRRSGRALLRDIILGLKPRGTIEGAVERSREQRRIAYLPGPSELPLSRWTPTGKQLARILSLRLHSSYNEAVEKLRGALKRLPGAPGFESLGRRPRELNRRERALGALALVLAQNPGIVVADDLAGQLDPVDAEYLLGFLLAAHAEYGFALLYLTGNPVTAARLGGRIAVLRDGRLIEEGPSDVLRDAPAHPYTQTLFRAVPLLKDSTQSTADMRGEPLLQVRGFALTKLRDGAQDPARLLSFDLRKGASVALIGADGSGRRALARAILGLDRAPEGLIIFDSVDVGVLTPSFRRRLKKRIAYITGDDAVLDPRMSVLETVAEPIRSQVQLGREQITRAAQAALLRARLSDLPERWLTRDLDTLQRRRLQIARAWGSAPQLAVLYEPTIGLGALGQALILDQLKELRASHAIATLVATADLTIAQALAEHALVIQDGALVESGPVDVLIHAPKHPYTQALVGAAWRRTRLEPPALPSDFAWV
jgi:peptide/nickel transport system ATP-binding protein